MGLQTAGICMQIEMTILFDSARTTGITFMAKIIIIIVPETNGFIVSSQVS